MSIQDNIAGRQKAEAAIELLMADLADVEVQAAMRVLRVKADSVLGPPPADLSVMTKSEASHFREEVCLYSAYHGTKWKNVPKHYIEAIADFGLELQRYLRSETGQRH